MNTKWITRIALLIAFIAIGFMYKSYAECTESGGVAVRGLIWVECINE